MKKAQDIMTTEVITANASMPVKELAKLLFEHHIGGMPVYDDDKKVIGVVTESDLIDQNKKVHIPTVVAILDSFIFLESPEKLEKDIKKMAATIVGDICSRELVSVQPDTPLDEVATLMAEQQVHTLPVMDDDKLVGVIGKSDIIRTIAQGG
ncbi:MAG: CBS domain-containing protein [Desulfobulbaceae bacterium]|nr:CBS domain-containing protein [Desulfobulbaceae bacterium]